MTPDQEVALRRLVRYAQTPEGRNDPAFEALIHKHARWIGKRHPNGKPIGWVDALDPEVHRIAHDERESIKRDENASLYTRYTGETT